MELVELLPKRIAATGLIPPGEPVVLGVSGGPDSLCLLDCLLQLGQRPIVAHFDHGLRAESAAEADLVAQLAADRGLPFEHRRADVQAVRGGRGSLEEVGRVLRYQFLVDVAQARRVQRIATAHTADDQVETVLMHLLRGAGPAGLSGMTSSTAPAEWAGIQAPPGLRLVRPLLTTWREEVERYCAQRGLQPLRDPSNLDPRHFRNRLRHELLRELEIYNPQVRQTLHRTAQIMAAQRELMEALAQAAWARCVREAGVGCLALDREAVQQEPLAIRRELVRKALHALRPDLRDLGFETVRSILQFVAEPASGRRSLVGGLELVALGPEVAIRQPGAVVQFPWYPQLRELVEHPLEVPGMLVLADGWSLHAARVELTAERMQQLTTGDRARMAALDVSRLHGRLSVRPPARGDRIQPLGMHGSMKLADLFVHRSVPRPARARWPVLVDEREVVWVAGLHLSREHCLRADSRQAVTLQLQVDHQAHPAGRR